VKYLQPAPPATSENCPTRTYAQSSQIWIILEEVTRSENKTWHHTKNWWKLSWKLILKLAKLTWMSKIEQFLGRWTDKRIHYICDSRKR
jgi:hypothetical protein